MDYVFVLTLLGVAAAAYWFGRSAAPASAAAAAQAPAEAPSDLAELAGRLRLDPFAPGQIRQDPRFQNGVRRLAESGESSAELAALAYSAGDSAVLGCMALEVLARRPADAQVGERLLQEVGRVRVELLYFYLRTLPALLPGRPLVGEVLLAVATHWNSDAIRVFAPLRQVLREFATARIDASERPSIDDRLDALDETTASDLLALIECIGLPALAPIAQAVQRWSYSRIDPTFLRTVGRLWTEESGRAATAHIVEQERLESTVRDIVATLAGDPPRSVLLTGELGVGKSVIARLALRRLQQVGWTVLEAGSTELQAGTAYVGELEARIVRLVEAIDARRKVVWYAPDFANIAWVGRHRYAPAGALDRLLPYIERGAIVVLGETEPTALQEASRLTPGLGAALRRVRVDALGEDATLDLARRWIALEAEDLGRSGETLVAEPVLREAWQLADQYLRDRASPGNLLHFLGRTLQRVVDAHDPAALGTLRAVTADDLIATLSGITGLPATILDERQGVDLNGLRRFFAQRVMGQPEGVDCLVERVAMIKAGVTDPGRPAGVFLFAGPTGTGKTAIAKALAAFLFGSERRLIVLDMSELQTPESLGRILGEPVGPQGSDAPGGDRSLVESVRSHPFSVILLDEFEKAHPRVWDLFLQVFDDGRLTDARGAVADFRHAIIILTSNLGVSIPLGTSLGFGGADGAFRAEAVMREIDRSFRREFVNRLDRIVVFRPLDRETMRDILRREIDLALKRRGLRNRTWAVEWEQPALEFLLEQGFTRDLGARPLKRAVERHFLAPLAETIVNHQYPRGDQFLFVRTDGTKLDVVFVDPDAPEPVADAAPAPGIPAPGGPEIESIVLNPRGATAEIGVLETRLEELAGRVEGEALHERKRAMMEGMTEPGFWESPRRFAVFGEIEYLDRIEAGLATSRSLLGRLKDLGRKPRASYPRDLVGRLAQQLYLLGAACADVVEGRPKDAFLEVDAGFGSGGTTDQRDAFARRVGQMYRAWGGRRGMQIDVLEESGGDGRQPYRLCLGVSGYGAHSILAPEEGVHVHEAPEEGHGPPFRKCAVHVRVAPQPEHPPTAPAERDRTIALRAQAVEALTARGRDRLGIVRRYRDLPSPLVRDDVRGWRSGLLDVVLAGNFDILR